MLYGNNYDLIVQVETYEENMKHRLEHVRQVRAARSARIPFAARVGDWMVTTGTQLRQRSQN